MLRKIFIVFPMFCIMFCVSAHFCKAEWGQPGWLYKEGQYTISTAKEGFRGVMWCQRETDWLWDRSFPGPCRVRKDEDYSIFGVLAKYITYTYRNSLLYGVRIDIEGKGNVENAMYACRNLYIPAQQIEHINDNERFWQTDYTSVWVTIPEKENGLGTIYIWGRDRKFPEDSKHPVHLAKPPALNSSNKRYKPRQYVAYRASGPIIVDGKLDEKAWRDAEWTEPYEDHQAPYAPEPWKTTRSKILYDDENIYFFGQLQEENVWGHLTVRDTIIYYDNDWEIFLNPTADGVGYYEFEINPLNYAWDMFHSTDYHRASCLDIYYNVTGLEHVVDVQGTLNWHHDKDTGWTIEVKWPLKSLSERNDRVKLPIERGDVWRINFSRVQYMHVYNLDFPYLLPHSPCEDWVWQSTNTGDLHNPEMWGKVIFSDLAAGTFKDIDMENAFSILEAPKPPKNRKKDMVYFEACSITMGPDPTDPEHCPAHTVKLPEFWMDRYEVTIKEYTDFLNEIGDDSYYDPWMQVPELCGIVKDDSGKYHVFKGRENYPVVFVSAKAAAAFAESKGKQLPSEAMWERAARGLDGRTYPWGDEPIDPSRANYDFHYGGTLPVGSLPEGATPEGIFDLCGNVKEWTTGLHEPYPGGKPMVYILQCPPWNRKEAHIFSVARGGAWTKQEACMAAGYRDTHGSLNMGFRCVRVK
ncbi:MAG: SUMF1/EgtB/PvdO family nonheme iron enzyme [Candidatus Latescibacteria bacterium]|nr:SUMF1/EgtB/PvdO family nonheme iron enzyme [Candidatus Latescibacterota bacterium]